MDWNALAAVGTLLAVIVAVGLPFLQRWLDGRKEDARMLKRTRIFAADFSSHLACVSLNTLHVVIALERLEKSGEKQLDETLLAIKQDAISISSSEAFVLSRDELELLHEDFAFLLSELRGRIAGYNVLVHHLATGPGRPGVTHEEMLADMIPSIRHLALCIADTICRLAAGAATFDARILGEMRGVVGQWTSRMPLPGNPDHIGSTVAEAGVDCGSP